MHELLLMEIQFKVSSVHRWGVACMSSSAVMFARLQLLLQAAPWQMCHGLRHSTAWTP
jgi:hypothetical protein